MAIHNNELLDIPSRPTRNGLVQEELKLGVLSDMISYQLRRAQLRLSHDFAKEPEGDGVTPAQLALLIKIKNNAGISQTALAKANGIERSTLGEIIDRFEKKHWVDRRKHSSDRRAYALHLSAQGELLLDAMIPAALAQEAALTANWLPEERATLLRLLNKLADS